MNLIKNTGEKNKFILLAFHPKIVLKHCSSLKLNQTSSSDYNNVWYKIGNTDGFKDWWYEDEYCVGVLPDIVKYIEEKISW